MTPHPDVDHAKLLKVALDASLRAGAAIMEVYASDFAVRRKEDASPVTVADERAERLIVAALRRHAPEIPIVAEEESQAIGLPTEAARRFWLVDPLDGTKEFIARNGEFTVNIALVEDGVPVLGVVGVPALDLTYTGCGPGTAALRRSLGPPEKIAARAMPAAGPVVVHSRSHENNSAFKEWATTQQIAETRVSGSSVKFCLLAAGEADLYPRFGPTMEWDTAAGHAVLLAAGGSVALADGTPLVYGKPGFRNAGFIARGR